MDESIENSAVRGSSGGKKRAESLSKEERSAIASAAAKARWAAKRKADAEKVETSGLSPITPLADPIDLPIIELHPPESEPIPDAPEEKHCPACLAGESLEEGEGTHILGTVEHPVTLPAAFADAETTVAVPEPPPASPRHPNAANPTHQGCEQYDHHQHIKSLFSKPSLEPRGGLLPSKLGRLWLVAGSVIGVEGVTRIGVDQDLRLGGRLNA